MAHSQKKRKLTVTVLDEAQTLLLLDRDFKSTAQRTNENQENNVSPKREISIKK